MVQKLGYEKGRRFTIDLIIIIVIVVKSLRPTIEKLAITRLKNFRIGTPASFYCSSIS